MSDAITSPSQIFAKNGVAVARIVVFIDPSVEDYKSLVAGVVAGAEAIVLKGDRNGVEQIASVLSHRTDIESVHIVSHGKPGLLQLGNSQLSLDNLDRYVNYLQLWKNAFTPKPLRKFRCETEKPYLLLYGCNVAATQKGATFVEQLSQLTGANVIASTNLTGNSAKGGDWQLEYATSNVKASLAFQASTLAVYQGILGFSIAYDSGVPAEVDNVVNYAVNLLDRAFDTTADTLDIQVKWEPLGEGIVGNGTGGDGTITDTKDFLGTPFAFPTPFYRMALANQLAGTDLNGSTPDITVRLNNSLNVPTYFGTDANPGADEVDLATTVIHEILHAMGFGDLFVFNASTGEGSLKAGDEIPGIYDTFLENGDRKRITDTALFPTPSVALGNALISNDLFFAGERAIAANGGIPPKIYAPNSYEDGSSILHLDEATFWDASDSLMTPTRSPGIAIHDPGPLTFAILQDLGWKLNPDLKVTQTADNATPKTGDTITYTITLTNIGPGEATNVLLTNTFSAGSLTLTNNTASSGTYNPDTNIWNVGNLANSTTATLTLKAKIIAPTGTTFTNIAELAAVDQNDNNSTNNFAKLDITVVNSAPTLDDRVTPTLTAINEDEIDNTGTLISALIASSGGISDPDNGAIFGIAVTAADNANGNWQFSTDNGSNWKDFVAVSDTSAILLASDANTKIRFVPNANFNGDAENITFRAWDRTSSSNGDIVDTSTNGGIAAFSTATQTANLTVFAVNDAPSFTRGSDLIVDEDVSKSTIAGWATRILSGAGDEASQTLNFLVSSDNNALFAVAPALEIATGNLTFTPAANAFGSATVTVQLKDDGGTINGGEDTSKVETFTITITPLNDSPTVSNVSKIGLEDAKLDLATSDFAGFFYDIDNNIISKIKITSLPTNGILMLGGTAATVNQEISFADLENLSYIPAANFNGNDSFGWTGFDGTTYATGNASINLAIAPVDEPSDLTISSDCPLSLGDIKFVNSKSIDTAKNGTEGDDILNGSSANDALDGKGGFDIAIGNDGSDNLNGSAGDDSLFGNRGADFLDGGSGADTLHGGKDDDTLKGNLNNDVLFGDLGADTLVGNSGNDLFFGNKGGDRLDGGDDDDTLYGGKEEDTLNGSDGNDILAGELGNDILCADNGNDLLFGNVGADTLDAGEDSDTLYGGKEADILYGYDGDDVLSGDLGTDTLTGGEGSDRFVLKASHGSDIITDFEDGIDFLAFSSGDLTKEQLTITSGAIATSIVIASTGELLASLTEVQASAIGLEDFTLV